MMKKTSQELLLPLRSGPDRASGWFDWLTDPLPKRFMLPATGLLIMGLDWLLFSEEAASLGLLLPFSSVAGFLAGCIGTFSLAFRSHSPALWRAPGSLLNPASPNFGGDFLKNGFPDVSQFWAGQHNIGRIARRFAAATILQRDQSCLEKLRIRAIVAAQSPVI
jgi:hypothetical protein